MSGDYLSLHRIPYDVSVTMNLVWKVAAIQMWHESE